MPPQEKIHFHWVDVFTDTPFTGNQLAVFVDGRSLTTEAMAKISVELNISEVTFVLPPSFKGQAHYRVRIFSKGQELPFAGHPVIGTAYVQAMLNPGILTKPITTFNSEVGIGILPVEVEVYENSRIGRIIMKQGHPSFGEELTDVSHLAKILGVTEEEITVKDLRPQVCSTGVNQLMVPIVKLETLKNIKPDLKSLAEFAESRGANHGTYLFTFETDRSDSFVHSRFFSPAWTVPFEDPATGSAAGALGTYLYKHGRIKEGKSFNVEQGAEIDRASKIVVEVSKETPDSETLYVKVGGNVCHILSGSLSIIPS